MIAHLGQAFSAAASDSGDSTNVSVCSGMSCGDCAAEDCNDLPGCAADVPYNKKCKDIKPDAIVGKDPTCIGPYGAPYVANAPGKQKGEVTCNKGDTDCNPDLFKCKPKCETNPLGCSSCPDDKCGSTNMFCYRPAGTDKDLQQACDLSVTGVFDYSTADLGADTTCVAPDNKGFYSATPAVKQEDGSFACPTTHPIDCVKSADKCQMISLFDSDNEADVAAAVTLSQRLSKMTSEEARAYAHSLAVVPCKQIKEMLGVTDDDSDSSAACSMLNQAPAVVDGIGAAMADAIKDLDCALSACKMKKSIGSTVVAALPSDAPACPTQSNAGPMVWGVCIGIIISVVAALIVRSHFHPAMTGRAAQA